MKNMLEYFPSECIYNVYIMCLTLVYGFLVDRLYLLTFEKTLK